MFSRLIFVVEGKETVFESHELVRILQCLTQKKVASAQDLRIGSYPNYARRLTKVFKEFSENLIKKYAQHSGLSVSKFSFLHPDSRSRYLDPLFVGASGFSAHLKDLGDIKSKDKPENPQITEDEFNDLILPEFIPQMLDVSRLLGMSKYAKENKETIRDGWWLNIGQRVVLLRNLPKKRQHLYVSDHGNTQILLSEVKRDSINPNTEEGREKMMCDRAFWKYFSSLSEEQKIIMKEHFIMIFNDAWSGDPAFFLQVLSLPEEYRKKTLKLGTLSTPGWNMAWQVGTNEKPLKGFDPTVLNAIPLEKRKIYLDMFNETVERMRYFGDMQTSTFVKKFIGGGLSGLFVKVDEIFNEVDSRRYKLFFVLNELALGHGKGLYEYLFRPHRSFGSPEEGESYRGFSQAFEEYFSSPNPKPASELAAIMRALLQGQPLAQEDLYFLPNLVAAWFVSEAARNPVSILTGLMLLDLIESHVELRDEGNNNLYSWRHTLIHPKKPANSFDEVWITDLYGNPIELAEFDGIHPMAHKNSIRHSKKLIGNKTELSPVQQKEGHLAIHWLCERVKRVNPAMQCYVVTAKPEAESTPGKKCSLLSKELTHYGLIDKLINASKEEGPSKSIKNNSMELEKWKVLHDIIIPQLEQRLSSLHCMLSAVEIKEVFHPLDFLKDNSASQVSSHNSNNSEVVVNAKGLSQESPPKDISVKSFSAPTSPAALLKKFNLGSNQAQGGLQKEPEEWVADEMDELEAEQKSGSGSSSSEESSRENLKSSFK